MGDSGEMREEDGKPIERKKARTVSARKVEANRRNALKSTGPKTRQGKAHSRKNALTHGLFATVLFSDFLIQTENPEEFKHLHDQLLQDLEPVGKTEELEVEYIAQCWWRRKRASRFENAETHGELPSMAKYVYDSNMVEEARKQSRSLIPKLKTVLSQIETNGKIPQELLEEMRAESPRFQQLWLKLEVVANEKFCELFEWVVQAGQLPSFISKLLRERPEAPETLVCLSDVVKTVIAINHVEGWPKQDADSVLNIAYDWIAIPHRDALDKLIRYETTMDKLLSRAYDRLERLQRRRKEKEEALPPPVSVH